MKELLEGLQINAEHRSPPPVRHPRSRMAPRSTLAVPILLIAPLALGAWYVAYGKPVAVEVFTVASSGEGGRPTAGPT